MQSKQKQIFLYCALWVVICLLVASLSGWVTSHSIPNWYASLNKPIFNPPNWVFAPVWTTLYIMIGIAGGVITNNYKQSSTTFWLYVIQLLLNFSWSFVFFGAHMIGLALINIVLLWFVILLTILSASKHSKSASLLLLPYWLWVSFASILNFSLLLLNK